MADGPLFELKLIGRLNAGQAVSRPQQTSDPDVSHKRHDQEKIRKVATDYAEEALLKYVSLMRTSPDERIQLQAADRILNRAIGMAKALSEEEKKGADAGSILDVLAAVSARCSATEQKPPEAPALEHEPKAAESSLESFLDELAEDAVIIND
jgi:hypothetical protein